MSSALFLAALLAIAPGDIRVEERDDNDSTVELKVKLTFANPRDRAVALEAFARMYREMSPKGLDLSTSPQVVPAGKRVDGKVAVADLMEGSAATRFVRDLQDQAKRTPPRSEEQPKTVEPENAWIPWHVVISGAMLALLLVFAFGFGTCKMLNRSQPEVRKVPKEDHTHRQRSEELSRREAALEQEVQTRAALLFTQLRQRLEGEESRLKGISEAQRLEQLQLNADSEALRRDRVALEEERRIVVTNHAAIQRERAELQPVAERVARLESVLAQLNAWSQFLGTARESEALVTVREFLGRLLGETAPIG